MGRAADRCSSAGAEIGWVARASSSSYLFASRPIVDATSLVTGATRAPAFDDGVLAVAKRGQMTGGPGGLTHSINLEPGIGHQRMDPRFRRVRPKKSAIADWNHQNVARHRCRRGLTTPTKAERPALAGPSRKRTTGLEPATFGLGSRRSTN